MAILEAKRAILEARRTQGKATFMHNCKKASCAAFHGDCIKAGIDQKAKQDWVGERDVRKALLSRPESQ